MAAETDQITIDSSVEITDAKSNDPSAVIEVERKFTFSDDTEQKIKEMGGELLQHKTFSDVYYDTSDFTLTLSDHWLRCRNKEWQLKCPPENRQKDTMTAQYAEHIDQNEIIDIVSKLLNVTNLDKNLSLADLVRETQCHSFASFQTDRKSYSLQEFSIDLDQTDFGFKVGEIEVIIVDNERLSDAICRINQLADKLGMYVLNISPETEKA